MTADRYLEICEQLGQEPNLEEMPPDWNDFPEIIQSAINTYNVLGDRVVADVGYLGKDYSLLPTILMVEEVENKELFLETLHWLDSRAIKRSAEAIKKQHDKIKSKSKKP